MRLLAVQVSAVRVFHCCGVIDAVTRRLCAGAGQSNLPQQLPRHGWKVGRGMDARSWRAGSKLQVVWPGACQQHRDLDQPACHDKQLVDC